MANLLHTPSYVSLESALELHGLIPERVRAEASSTTQARLLALAARISIIVLAGAMGLRQMGLATEIITIAFGMFLGSIAVAAALAFGLGCRDLAGRPRTG